MEQMSILPIPGILSLTSCATGHRGTPAQEGGAVEFQPKPLDDEWSQWIVGEWEGPAEGDAGQKWSSAFETALNQQFAIHRSEADLAKLPEKDAQFHPCTREPVKLSTRRTREDKMPIHGR